MSGSPRAGPGVQLQAGDTRGEPARLERSLGFLALSGIDIGHNPLSPVSTAYRAPFPFQGTIERITVTVERDQNAEPPRSTTDTAPGISPPVPVDPGPHV